MLATLVSGCAGMGAQEQAAPVFFPPVPETPRIQYLTSFGTEWDVTGVDRLEIFLYGEREPAKIVKPYGVDIRDGKIFVVPVEEAIRIRTGEEGEDVLQAHEGSEVPAT